MERIDPAGPSFYSPASRNKKKVKKKDAKKLSFSSLVADDTKAADAEEGMEVDGGVLEALGLAESASLEEMLDVIHTVGDQVRENASRETVIKYRQAVKAFMKYVLGRALVVDVKSSSPNILRQKKFTLVRVIDRKLESLASGVLLGQHDTLEILARIDEINGLLVDLIS
jgi:uncharacterized protein YaaR (DUF327 family)